MRASEFTSDISERETLRTIAWQIHHAGYSVACKLEAEKHREKLPLAFKTLWTQPMTEDGGEATITCKRVLQYVYGMDHPSAQQLVKTLLETGSSYLVAEAADSSDTFWGVVQRSQGYQGHNMYGRLLMGLRRELHLEKY